MPSKRRAEGGAAVEAEGAAQPAVSDGEGEATKTLSVDDVTLAAARARISKVCARVCAR